MVCSNCKSKDIITIQDQLFCINCGQMVSPNSAAKSKVKAIKTTIVSKATFNDLPTGVKIIEPDDNEVDSSNVTAEPVPTSSPPPVPTTKANVLDLSQAIITNHQTSRTVSDLATNTAISSTATDADQPAVTKLRKRKPGRPKAGRLDSPRITHTTPAPVPADKPPIMAPEASPIKRHVSDIRPRTPKPESIPEKTPAPAHHVHKVGVAPLHFGSIITFSLRAQAKRHHLMLAMGSALLAGVMAGIGAWYLLTTSPAAVMTVLANHWLIALVEAIALIKLYYIGHTIGHSAIVYGVAREADHRPISLSMQLGAAINSFTRRLRLDSLYGLTQIALLCAIAALVLTGGTRWPVPSVVQVTVLYGAFLVLLYLMSAAAMTRGLASVAVVLSNDSTAEAYKLGWKLFRHRLELIGIRLLSCIVELLVVLPLLAAGVSLYLFLPPIWHGLAALGIGIITWLIGSLMGAGSAAWWASVYRKIVILDQPTRQFELLAGRVPGPARGRYLGILAAVSGFLLASVLLIPLVLG